MLKERNNTLEIFLRFQVSHCGNNYRDFAVTQRMRRDLFGKCEGKFILHSAQLER